MYKYIYTYIHTCNIFHKHPFCSFPSLQLESFLCWPPWEVPLLALHGEEDKVLPAECSRTLVQRAVSHGANAKLLLTKDTHQMESAFPHVFDFILNLGEKWRLNWAALAARPSCHIWLLNHRFTFDCMPDGLTDQGFLLCRPCFGVLALPH